MSTTTDERTRRIRNLNNALRRSMVGGSWTLTYGVMALGHEAIARLVRTVQAFDGFTPDNDPYGENDFGAVEVDSTTFFFKIDYYDIDKQMASPDPSDETVTARILTVMRADEY